MNASHGRSGRSWLLTALAASGPLAFTLAGAAPARASLIVPRPQATVPAAGPAQHATGRPDSLTPTSYLPPVHPPAALTPSPTSAVKPVVATATLMLPAATPTVGNWDAGQPPACNPPAPPDHWSAPTPIHHGPIRPPTGSPKPPLKPPAALEVLPTPEPSTALIGLVLAGAFAWRRRRGH